MRENGGATSRAAGKGKFLFFEEAVNTGQQTGKGGGGLIMHSNNVL